MKHPKGKDYRPHVLRRSVERLGFEICRETYLDWMRQIRTGEGQFLERESNKVTKWLVTHKQTGTKVPIVYDKKYSQIVTILPLDCVEVMRFRKKMAEAAIS